MSVSFARQTKLSNISGRSNYISNPSRQDNIVLHSTENLQNSWNDYAKYENENKKNREPNNQGREIIIHLPHELADDKTKLKKVVDDYSKKVLGDNRDFEYAVHWNQKESNLHAHIIFSERERNLEREPKTYKRDMWYDKDTNKMTKANAENSELRYKKGDFQRDKDTGEIIYNDDPFTIKDRHFVSKQFNEEIKEIHKEVMNEHGFNFRLFDPEKEVAQKHIGNKAEHQPEVFIHENKETGEVTEKKNPYVLQAKANQEYNENVKGMNAFLQKAKMTVQEYMEKFKQMFRNNIEKLENELKEKHPEYMKARSLRDDINQELKMIDNQVKNLSNDIQDYKTTHDIEVNTKEIAKGYNKGFNKGDLEQYQENADRKLAEQQKREKELGKSRGR